MKKRFKIEGMHCASCTLIIDMDLDDLDGVKSSKTSYAKMETNIEFDPAKVTDDLILQTIKKSGYTAVSLDS